MRAEMADVAGLRFFTRNPVTLPWLSRSVIPMARAVRAQDGAVVRLRRGWLHGPHVDLLAHGGMGRSPLWDRLAEQFDAGPQGAAGALSEEQYLAQAREFGRLENVAPPYLPLREHGTVEYLGAADVLPRDELLRDLREIEVVNSALCVPLLDTVEALAQRPGEATVRLAEAFAALADSYFLGLAHGVYSFRSHAEAFLSWAAPTKDVRPAFAARLEKDAPQMRKVVEERLSGRVGALAGSWRTAFAYATGALDGAVRDGRLTVPMLDSVTASVDNTRMGPPGAVRDVPQGAHPDSDFHRAVVASGVIDTPTPWFASYRMLINLFYEQLPLLTVPPMQRYYMCYALAETVDDVLGETWQQRLADGQARMARGEFV
ncbi:hypothetical protein ACFWZ2_02140 [Streptomyces sp. NPDC059002]|uniref:hypothetical protein n=1 Tax=Streptomyces sp. NPDC059002 TaxID=3346690 RepID=UPI00368EC3DD